MCRVVACVVRVFPLGSMYDNKMCALGVSWRALDDRSNDMTTATQHSLAAEYARDVARGIADSVANDVIHDGDYVLDYLESVLDIQLITDTSGRYIGARLLLSCGGPNAWLDTSRGELSVFWGSDRATEYVNLEFCELLDEHLAEYFGN